MSMSSLEGDDDDDNDTDDDDTTAAAAAVDTSPHQTPAEPREFYQRSRILHS